MLSWLKKRGREDHTAAEHRAVLLVEKVFGPGVEDVTPYREVPRTAA